jgi:NAD(P)H dehydrogenase (quinone)
VQPKDSHVGDCLGAPQKGTPLGYSPYIRQHISAVAQDCRDGVFSGTNDLVEKITGQKPMEMPDYIAKNKALFC